MKKILTIFFLAFILNLVWENLHSLLYNHYQGGSITQLILLRAALFDATFITIIGTAFINFDFLIKRDWLILPIGFTFAVLLELYALGTNRWAYNEMMPIIPILSVGFTPALQLGLTAYVVFKLIGLKR